MKSNGGSFDVRLNKAARMDQLAELLNKAFGGRSIPITAREILPALSDLDAASHSNRQGWAATQSRPTCPS